MTWAPTVKCASYIALVAIGMFVALASGRPEPVVLAAPLAAFVAVGLATARHPGVSAHTALDVDQATEGDHVQLTIEVSASATISSLQLFVELPAGVRAPARARLRELSLGEGETQRIIVPIRCERWGSHRVGAAYLRVRSVLGLLESEQEIPAVPLRVYPRPETLRRLVAPRHTQSAPGSQVARTKGAGVEFADLRAFATGDRVRDVNWRATARRGTLLVNDRHPDRSTDVVLFLDTFDDTTLPDAVRLTNSLATAYLTHRDRVGLVGFGGTVSWLRTGMGLRQQYLVVHTLLATTTFPNAAWKDIADIPPRILPSRALVVALSPLQDERTRSALVELRSRGIDLVVVELAPRAYAPPPADEDAGLARRLWALQREGLRNGFRDLGIPVVEWTPTRPLADVIEEIRGMAAHRPSRPVAGVAAALVPAAGVGAFAVARRSDALGLMVLLVCAAVALIGCGVVLRRGAFVALGAGMVAAAFTIGEIGRPVSLLASTAAAVLLFASLELAFAAMEPTGAMSHDHRARRRTELAITLTGGLIAAFVVATASFAHDDAGLWLLAAGALSAMGLLALLARELQVRARDPRSLQPPRHSRRHR